MLTKNSIVIGLVTDQGKKGEGIVWDASFPTYVANAIPGDRIEYKVLKVEKRRAFGKLLRVLAPSNHRVHPECAIAGTCGGCQLQHQSQAAQVAFKSKLLLDRLSRTVEVSGHDCRPMISGESQWATRNKMQFSFGCGDGAIDIGLYAPRSHRVVNADYCHVMSPDMNGVLGAVRGWLGASNWPVFNEGAGTGVLRFLTIRFAPATGQLMVVLTLAKKVDLSLFIDHMIALDGMISVYLCVQPDASSDHVLSHELSCIWGAPSIEDVVCGIRCQVSPHTFMQANAPLVDALYAAVLEAISHDGPVLDLYCGAGILSCVLAKHGAEVIGVDNNASAIEDATKNAATNGVHVNFQCMDVGLFLTTQSLTGVTVLVDPPRKGLDIRVVQALIQQHPQRLVYVSCSPDTLARDLKLLLAGGYVLEWIQPVDMFCHTPHIECVVVLHPRP